jgi:hypothetical protein
MKSKIAWREVPVEKRRSPPEDVCLGQVLQEVGSVCKKPKRRNLHLVQLLRAYCDNQYDASSKRNETLQLITRLTIHTLISF